MSLANDQSGQASVELVAVLPLLAAVLALGWQAVLAGQSWWLAGSAARAAARAALIGSDPRAAGARVLPPGRRSQLRVSRLADGRLLVRVPIPVVFGDGQLGHASAVVAP